VAELGKTAYYAAINQIFSYQPLSASVLWGYNIGIIQNFRPFDQIRLEISGIDGSRVSDY
jgi:hypothetical protein